MDNGIIDVIIVEDEKDSQALLCSIINEYCSGINIKGIASSIEDAKMLIVKTSPNLVFLDIELNDGNSFELFEYFSNPSFKIVFTTAYEDFAVKAFQVNAVDYLLKPYSPKMVKTAVNKVIHLIQKENVSEKIEYLASRDLENRQKKLKIHTSEGIELIDIYKIIRVKANRAYCNVHLLNDLEILVSKPLGFIENALNNKMFFRVHNSEIINLEHMEKYISEDGGYIKMIDGSIVNIARRRKEEFLKFLDQY